MSKLFVPIILSLFIYYIRSEVIRKRSTCGVKEMLIECVHCGPKTCADLGRPIKCAGATAACRPECVCIDGHVRDANGICIPKIDCPSCDGDHNATSGCGNHCGKSCSDYKEIGKECFNDCQYNRCDCKIGYVYHDRLKACMLPIDCFPKKPPP